MLYNLILQFLPFFITFKLLSVKKAHTEIQLKEARKLKIVMINNDIGIAIANNKYDFERAKKLKKVLEKTNKIQKSVYEEVNKMSFIEKEMFMKNKEVNDNDKSK